MKKFLLVLLVIVVVCCIYGYGSGTRFSLEVYITRITTQFEAIPTIEGLISIWGEVGDDGSFTGGGDGWVGGRSGSSVDSEQSFWDKTVEFFERVGSFFSRLWESILHLVSMLVGLFKVLPCLLPWNATVPILV